MATCVPTAAAAGGKNAFESLDLRMRIDPLPDVSTRTRE